MNLVIINPHARGYNNISKKILEIAFKGNEFVYAAKRKDIHKAINSKKYKEVIAVGGDGTVSAAASALVKTKIPLTIIPLGTGNIIAKSLDISTILPLTIKQLKHLKPRKIDVIKLNEDYYLMNVSIGLTSLVIKYIEKRDKKRLGTLAYLIKGLKLHNKIRENEYKLNLDGKKHIIRGTDVFISNIGIPKKFGLKSLSKSLPDDGLLEILVAHPEKKSDYIKLLRDLVNEKPGAHFKKFTAKKIKVKSRLKIPVQADGEKIRAKELSIEILPKALTIKMPSKN